MKIKEFSKLCGCNPKTLRYYDEVGLLMPIKVDPVSGYRYYGENQALDFIKIKNLQRAGFTIEEMKSLIYKDDSEIFYAFENKIKEAEKKIMEIRTIQNSYRSEIIDMRNKIKELQELLEEAKGTYDPVEEFGLCRENYERTIDRVNYFLEEIGRMDDYSKFEYTKRSEEEDDSFLEECLSRYETVFTRHGWTYFKEVYSEIPELSDEYGYLVLLKVKEKADKTSYAGAVIGVMLDKLPEHHKIGCTVIDSKDNENHFWLVRFME